jgi:uncharacterized membrane protein
MESIFAQIRDISKENLGVVVNALPGQDPTNMRPKTAVLRRMWIPFLICVLVVHSMYRNKEDRTTLQSEGAAYSEDIFNPFRGLIPPMR